MSFSANDRNKNIEKISSQDFDLLIIGGGITGSGVARDASMRGMKVALVESNDFASGTSCRSSKLIHGGIRYLENLEFHLVFEALNERTKLFEMAPHLTHHLRFMLPLYKSSRVGMFKMGLGMWLYDALALFQAPEMHERLNAKETIARTPHVRGENLLGSYVYSDGYMDDDRLAIETLRSAVDHGATVANYVSAIGFDQINKKVRKIKCRDEQTKKEFFVSAKHVISSVGPWTDELGHSLFQQWKNVLRPTKGVHLTFAKDRLPLSSAVVMAAENSSRIVFAIPRHEMIIVGTTDTDFKGSPSEVVAEKADIDYILEISKHYFPGAKLEETDIIASYAGVRPLVHDGSSSEGKTSREHVIWNDERGITFVAGGKYTTYRLMSEQIVDKALENFILEDRVKYSRVNTATALNQYTTQDAYQRSMLKIEELATSFGMDLDSVLQLTQRYGDEAEIILNKFASDRDYIQIESMQAIYGSMCLNLVDFWTRRTHLFLSDPTHGKSCIDKVANTFQKELGWTNQQRTEQIKNLENFFAKELAWNLHR